MTSTTQPHPQEAIAGETQHVPELDGVRGLAILAVMLSHGVAMLGAVPRGVPGQTAAAFVNAIFTPGWGGVDLFFTLSGFLITGILLRTRARPTYFKSFYARRVVRIFPIYYLFLIFTLLVAKLSPTFAAHVPASWMERLSYFLYVQNWPVFWQSWAGLGSLWGAYWSLAVEEQFYMVWPAVVRFVSIRTMLCLCVAGFLLGWPERALMIHLHGMSFGLMQWPFSRLDGLFLGAAIALYRELYGRPVPKTWAVAAVAAGAVMWLGIVLFHAEQLQGAGVQLWERGVTGFALMSGGLIALTHYKVPSLQRALTVRALLLAGRLSYGMYVYHLCIYWVFTGVWRHALYPRFGDVFHPLAAFFFIAAAIVTTTAVAWLSFRYIESPFLRLKRYFPSAPAPL